MSHKIHPLVLARDALCTALLTSSAIAVAQDFPVTQPPVVEPVPEVPAPPVVPPIDVPAPSPAAPIAAPADTVAPEALQNVAEEKSAARPVANAPRKPVASAVAPQAAVTQEIAAPDVSATTIPPAAPALPEAIAVAPVDENSASLPADESGNDWLLAAAGLGALGAAGGIGLVAIRRRKRKTEAQSARIGIPAVATPLIERNVTERPIAVPQPVAMATPLPSIAPVITPPISRPALAASTDPLFSAKVPNIPVTDPLFATQVEIPPITDPMFADNPDYVGNRQAFKGFAQNPSPSWAKPRPSTLEERVPEYVN